ncbi:MAG: aldehyde dehydrogenase family protein [Gammaproteobacteria bacterium]|nr:aldehyde dehydrogenase family protein [Gammaproteobacteria bacterium]
MQEHKEDFSELVTGLRKNFINQRLTPLLERDAQLTNLNRMLTDNQEAFERALFEDLGKPGLESFMTEIAIVQREIRDTQKQLSTWAAPKKVSTFFALQPASSYVQSQPLGVVLIIAPWNYPVQLSLLPLVGAIAAGNCVVLKPSELASHTSELLATLIPEYLNPDFVKVVTGGIVETTQLLEQKFDHVFFTGGSKVGRIIYQAAAKMGATCTLELGGKSPCIVDENVNLSYTAENIIWGKFLNAGQTCIAPDYILVHKNIEQALLAEMKKVLIKFYGEDAKKSKDYGRIINQTHHQRLMHLLAGQKVYVGGDADEEARYIAPTILSDVSPNDKIMHPDEEIFGPILPVLTVESIDDAITFIRSRPDPLVIYLFSSYNNVFDVVAQQTRSGAISFNATIVYNSVVTLPFGGIGESGQGKYHGKFSFDTFSHQRALFSKVTWPDFASPLTHPPYTDTQRMLLKYAL